MIILQFEKFIFFWLAVLFPRTPLKAKGRMKWRVIIHFTGLAEFCFCRGKCDSCIVDLDAQVAATL